MSRLDIRLRGASMDGTNAPALSQAVKPDPIFAGLRIFVQASGIGTDRPKFIRTLKERGASSCSILNDAQIILINPESEEGQALIPPWSNLPEPKLLTMDWVQKCSKAGRALLAEDDWGGCLVKYDRASHRDDDDDDWEEDDADIPSKSPLPTPRQTPSEPSETQPWFSSSATRSSAGPTQQARREGSQMPPSAPSTTPSDTATVTPTDLLQNGQPFFPAFSAVNGMQTFSPQFAMQMAAMFNPLTTPMDPRVNPLTTPIDPRMMAMLQTMQDIMTRANSGSQMQPAVYNPSGQQSPVQEQALPFPDVPSEWRSSKRRPGSFSPIARRSFSELSDGHSLIDKKGKRRASSPTVKRRKTSSSSHQIMGGIQSTASAGGPSSSQKRLFVKCGRPLAFFVQIDLHNRGAVVDAIKKNGGRIEKDPENADYAVLYSGHKQQKTFNDLLESAQTAGKPAVRSAFVHDCVAEGILLDCKEYEFESTAKRKRKSFVTVKSEPLNSDDERKRLAKNAREAERRKQQQLEKERTATAPTFKGSPASRVKVEQMSSPKRKESINVIAHLNGRQSPIPPGEHTRQPWATGYRFTLEEDQFLCDYAQILAERDHTISASAIAERVYAKMPHHSLNSWKARMGRVIQDKLDDWRKRSGIAYRKALKASQSISSQSLVLDTNVNDSDVIEVNSSSSPLLPQDEPALSNLNDLMANDSESVLRNEDKAYVKQDIEVVSRFFATLEDDGQEPEELVWARLSSQSPCRAWHDWAAFYEAHYHEVQKRYGELTGNTQLQ